MSIPSHASHVYRGYRLQALYALYRIFISENVADLVFQPEGKEDLLVIDLHGNMVEINQVKAYTSNLTLSDFSPEKPDSFLYRSAELMKTLPDSRIKIVSYGVIGPELLNAIESDGQERKKLAAKFSRYGFISEEDAQALLEKIELQSVNEEIIRIEINRRLQDSCVGVDPNAAFDLLNKWLFDCSEDRRKIRQKDAIDKILSIGKFLAERAAHIAEWGTTIIPIEDRKIDEDERRGLDKEFYFGVSTVYDHILAGLDIIRESNLQEISRGFDKARVVIVHGASGQGKTALAYRYFHDAFPNHWRFRIRLIENRQHALRIAAALNGHADAIGIPIAVYLDVTAKDSDWPDFIKEASLLPGIRLLVTIREEDWHRTTLSGAVMRFSEVSLTFSEVEAKEIYGALAKRQTVPRFLDFGEAWHKYGGQGPLMEFVYLVTQGNTLRERLAEQVTRLKEDVRAGKLQPNELSLLRLAAVASAYEARLQAGLIVSLLGLPAPDQTLRYFEEEYLFRLSADRSLISGLHPIRSLILADLLTDSTFTPWIDSANLCLPCINEEDIEIFLLYAFLRRPEDASSIINALHSFQPKNWTAIAGILRALIWLGLREYVKANHDLIHELFQKYGKAWHLMLDFDVAGIDPKMSDNVIELIGSLLGSGKEVELKTQRTRQTDKGQIFKYAKEWLSVRNQEPCSPKTDHDWAAIGESLFWVGRFGISWPLVDWLPDITFDKAIDELPLSILADVVYGLSIGCPSFFQMWMANNRPRIISRLQQQGRIMAIEDNGQKVTAHFIVGLDPSYSLGPAIEKRINESKNRSHEETIILINLMRKLLPDRELFASQGYGHRIQPEDSPDDTQKTGIDKKNLPLTWLILVNSTFRNLAEEEFRPHSWSEYAKTIFFLRRDIANLFQALFKGLENYFRKTKPLQLFGTYLNPLDWDTCRSRLNSSLFLPRCTLDEWGFVGESMTVASANEVNTRIADKGLAISQYRQFLETFNDYFVNLSNFFAQAQDVIVLNPILGRSCRNKTKREQIRKAAEEKGIKVNTGFLSAFNLGEVIKKIPRIQAEFDRLLGQFIEKAELMELNHREQTLYRNLWNVWYIFVTQPDKHTQNTKALITWTNDVLTAMRRGFHKEFKKLSDDRCIVRIISENLLWDERPALWITIDSKDVFKPFEMLEKIVTAIRKSTERVPDIKQRQYMIDFHWPTIVLIPLVQGKALSDMTWKWPLLTILYNDTLRWWQLIPESLPPEAIAKLDIALWDNEGLNPAQALLMSNSELTIIVKHVADFLRLPKEVLDEQGTEILQEYLVGINDKINHAFQSLADSITTIANRISELKENLGAHPFLGLAAEELAEISSAILPVANCDGKFQIDLEGFGQWSEQLTKSAEIIMKVYLFWISDVIEQGDSSTKK